MFSILGFIIILGPLVVVHEFGHFLFARIFGVKAEVFSIGFGPKLWKKQFGETEFCVSAIPLGGYVKLLGEDLSEEGDSKISEAERKRALQFQPPWKRFFIFFGGPLFNFIFAIVIFMAIMLIGEPKPANFVVRILPDSVAYESGFRSGDKIIEVASKPVSRFEDVVMEVREHPDEVVEFKVLHRNAELPETLKMQLSSEEGFSLYGERRQVGMIDGMIISPRLPKVGVSNSKSPAGKAGIITGDIVSRVNTAQIISWEQLEWVYADTKPGEIVNFELESEAGAGKPKEASFVKPKRSKNIQHDLGLYSSELFIDKVVAESPAEKAGLLKGDRIVSISGKILNSYWRLKETIQNVTKEKGNVKVAWERDGKLLNRVVVPTENQIRDPLLKKVKEFTIGILPLAMYGEPEYVINRIWNPFVLLYEGTSRMVDLTWRNVVVIRKMISGDVSVATLGGPILIGKIAGESLSRGLIAFLTTMAILSVGLGILNVLPIPVLDGGHLLLLGIEGIRGKPMKLRQMEILQQVGLAIILGLMILVIKNDLTRLPFFN